MQSLIITGRNFFNGAKSENFANFQQIPLLLRSQKIQNTYTNFNTEPILS